MLTTKQAIEKRRSIRNFLPDPVPDEHVMELIEAARLAPSGCNAQPWRFRIVKDRETKEALAHAAFDQSFVAQAPVVIVACTDITGYLDRTSSAIQDLGKIGAVEDRIVEILNKRMDNLKTIPLDQLAPNISFNVAIALEHIVLRALDFGLGTCWIRLMDGPKINQLFGWKENIHTTALLPVGYPAEDPEPRKRMEIEDLLI